MGRRSLLGPQPATTHGTIAVNSQQTVGRYGDFRGQIASVASNEGLNVCPQMVNITPSTAPNGTPPRRRGVGPKNDPPADILNTLKNVCQ
jgi:hypothetical protein